MKVSIIIPAFNEEKAIGQTIEGVKAILGQQGVPYELIVVDDASTDKTAEIASSKGARVIPHQVNHGYGAALKTGVQAASCQDILMLDADGTYPAAAIPALLKDMDSHDMVVGARVGLNVQMPIMRRLVKWFLVRLANYLSDSKIPDLNSGMRALKRELFLKFSRLLPDGFSTTTTITMLMLTGSYRVKFVPIDYHRRLGRSKFRPIADTLNFLQLLIRISLLSNPLRIFLPFSLLMGLGGIAAFIYSKFFLPYRLDVTALILIVGGMQILAIGMLADLINKRMS